MNHLFISMLISCHWYGLLIILTLYLHLLVIRKTLNDRFEPLKTVVELVDFDGERPTRKWVFSGSQVSGQLVAVHSGAGMCYDTVVNRSQVILENFLTWKRLPSHIGGALGLRA